MEKHNDWLASMFFQPDMNLQDLADMGVTTENSELKSRDYYKSVGAIKETFSENGVFNDKAYNAYYDSVERVYNVAAQQELVGNILNQKTYDERDHTAPVSGKLRDYTPSIVEFANPLGVTHGTEGVGLISDPILSVREAAQKAAVFNTETGKFEDYTPNDLNVLSFWTAPNLILAKNEDGTLKLNEEGSPFYETLGGRSAVGQELLHVSDILTTDGSAWNQYDFFDSDGLDKTAFGTVMKTAVSIAPYLIPGVGQYVAMFEIGRSLVESLPELYKGVSSLVGSDLGFSTANEIAAFASRFNSSISDAGAQKLLSFESIGNMAVDSIKQLYAQRTLWKGIQKLIPANSPEAIKKAKNLSLSYMAITSTTQSYEQFKQAGASDFMAGLGAVGTMLGTWKLMTTDYFRNYALGDELERNTLLPGVKGAADEFANVFNYKTAQLPKKKAAEFINKVANYVTKEGVVQGALNESVEEVMEEGVADMVKGISLALNKLGLADSNKTYDFGFSGKDFLSRYGTAFVGGAIGGAVFSTHDIVERRLSGKTDDITPSGISDLVFYLRRGEGDKLRKIAKELRDKRKLGSTSLSTEILRIENNNGEEQVVYKPATSPETSQNEAVYKYLLDRFDTIETLLKKENLLITDTFLKALVSNPDFDYDKLGQEDLKVQAQLFAEESMENALQGGLASRVVNDFQEIAEKLVATELKMRRLLTPAVDESSDNKAIEDKIESVKNSSEYKELEAELKTLREKRDEILTGKRNGYYLEQGLFVGSYDFAHMFNIPLNVKSYTKLNYDKNYDDLSDDKKKSLDEEFRVYLNKEGKESIYYAFELFRNLSAKTKELVEKQGSRFESFREYFRGSELFGANWQIYRQDLLSAKEHAEKQSKEGPEELRAGYQAQVDDINESLSKYPESLVFAPIYNVTRTTKNIVRVPTKNNGETDAQFITRLNTYLDEVSAYVSSIKKADGFIESGDLTIKRLFDALHQVAKINPGIKSELDVVNEYYAQRRWDELAKHINESGLDMLGEEDPLLGRFITTVEEVAQTMATLETNPALVLMQNILSNLEKDPVAYSHLLNVLSLAERTSDPSVLEINDDQTLNSLKQIDSLLPIAYAIVKSAISGGYNTIINRINKNNAYAELNEDSGLEFQDDIQALKNKLDYILDVVEKNRLSKVTVQQNLYYHIAPLIFKQIRDFDLEKLQNAFEDAFSEQGSLKELIKKYNIPESLEAKTPEAFGKYYQQVCLFESEFRQRIISTYTMDQVAEKLESIYGQAAASEPNMHFSTDAKAVKSEDMLLYLASIINSDSVEFHKKVWEAIADKRFEKAVLFPQLYDVRILYAQMWNPDAIQFFNKILEIFKANEYNKFAESFTTDEERAKGEISSDTKYLQSRFILSNFTSPIRGSAGTGKTGGVFALTTSLLNNVECIGLVPSEGQKESLKTSTKAKIVYTKDKFFDKLGIKSIDHIIENNMSATATEEQKEFISKASNIFSKEHRVIVLDEFSLFNSVELELISAYAKTHGIIVVSAGDFKQNKKTLPHEYEYIQDGKTKRGYKYIVHSIDDCVVLNTPELLASLRASNVAKLMNATQLENILLPVYDKLKKNPTMTAAEISTDLESMRINFVYTRDKSGAVVAGEKLINVDANRSLLHDEIDKLLETIPSDSKKAVCVITNDKSFYDKYNDDVRIEVRTSEESQGREYDYVILDINPEPKKELKESEESKKDSEYSQNTFMMLSSYYTAIERSRKATLIAHYPKNKVQFADSEYSRGANAIETDSKFIADMMDFYNKAFNWVNSIDDPDYEDSWYNEESEDDSDDEEDDNSDEDPGEESVDEGETEEDENDSKKPKGKKKTTPRKKPTPKKVKRTSTKTVEPKKTPVKRTAKKTSAGTSIGTYKPSANAAKLPIRINVEKIRTLFGTDKEFGIKFAINSLPKKSSIKAFLTSSDANYYYGALYWACVRETLPDNWKSVFKKYGDEDIISLLESATNKEYNVKTVKHNGEEINIITCSLLDAAGNILITIPITCVDNKPTKAQLQRIKGWKISTDVIAFDDFVSLSDIPSHLHKSKIMVLNAAKLSGNKDTFARMNNGGAFMYVSEDIFESIESPTIFEVDSSGHTTSLWESNAHGGLIAVNDVRPLSELESKIQAKHIAHSAINAALRCANDSEDGEYFANLFLEQLYKRLSRSNKKSQKIILERTTISSGETVSAELTIKDSTISLKIGNRKSITWSVGDSTNSSEIFAELNSIFKTEGAERYTYKTIVDKKENFYVIADALEQTFKEGRKHKKLKSVSKLKINASIATQNVHVQDVWNNIDRKNSFSYNATIYTIAAPILERSESSEETREEVKPKPKKKTKVKPEIADVLKKVVAELNLFGTTPNQLTTDGTWYLYDAGGLLSVNQSTGKYNYNPNTILPEGVTVNDIADLFASEEILGEYLDNGGDDSIAELIENLKKDDNTQNCSM